MESLYEPPKIGAAKARVRRSQTAWDGGNWATLFDELVVGQAAAKGSVIDALSIWQAGLHDSRRPVATIALLGPTGVGKTHLVHSLAEAIHGNPRLVLRIDGGEYKNEHEVARLVGAPPGYLGHKETQALLSQARLNGCTSSTSPISVVLFDEIEKTATSIHQLLLGIMDNGELKIGDGSTVHFGNAIIFLTSNVGAEEMRAKRPGYAVEHGLTRPHETLDTIAIAAFKRKFSPEFINRLDTMTTCYPLTRTECEEIIDKQLDVVIDLVVRRYPSTTVTITTAMREHLLTEGFNLDYGGRELKRVIRQYVTLPIAGVLLTSPFAPPRKIQIDIKEGRTEIS